MIKVTEKEVILEAVEPSNHLILYAYRLASSSKLHFYSAS